MRVEKNVLFLFHGRAWSDSLSRLLYRHLNRMLGRRVSQYPVKCLYDRYCLARLLGVQDSGKLASHHESGDVGKEPRHNDCLCNHFREADEPPHVGNFPNIRVCSGDTSGSTIVPAYSPHVCDFDFVGIIVWAALR